MADTTIHISGALEQLSRKHNAKGWDKETLDFASKHIRDAEKEIATLRAEIFAQRDELDKVKAALAEAEKCIYDAETYLDWGSGKYAYKTVKTYQAAKTARAALGQEVPH